MDKRSMSLRPVCKKIFECPKCDCKFVREDSLRSHLRNHKFNEQSNAQAHEQQGQRLGHHPGETQPQEPSEILQAALAQSEILPPENSPERAPNPKPGSDVTKNILLAIMQNNQNSAVEDNLQNLAISNQHSAATSSGVRDRHHSAPDMRSIDLPSKSLSDQNMLPVAAAGHLEAQPLYLVENVHTQSRSTAESVVSHSMGTGAHSFESPPEVHVVEPSDTKESPALYDGEQVHGSSASQQPIHIEYVHESHYVQQPQVMEVILPASAVAENPGSPPVILPHALPQQQHVVLRMPLTQASNLLQAMQLQPANQQPPYIVQPKSELVSEEVTFKSDSDGR